MILIGPSDMDSSRANEMVGNIIVKYFKTIITCIVFLFGFFLQYHLNMVKLERMEEEIQSIKSQMESHYAKLDNVKLDKVIFETSMRQVSEMSSDIRQIRDRLEDVLSDHSRHVR